MQLAAARWIAMLGAGAALTLGCACARAQSAVTPDWARFATPQQVAILGYEGDAMEPFLSRDGGLLFFNNRNEPADETDLHWAERIDDLTFRYRGRIDAANSATLDGVPTMSRDGRFCFISPRAYDETLATVYCGAWRDGRIGGVERQLDASPRIPGDVIFDAEISADGRSLYLAQGDFRGGGGLPRSADLRLARLVGASFSLSPADDAMFASVNTDALEYAAAISSDGRTLSFTRVEGRPPFARIGIWVSRRAGPTEPFGPPVRIAALNGFVEAPTFSDHDDSLYYHRLDGSHFSIWRATMSH